jgi:hypothetical protein
VAAEFGSAVPIGWLDSAGHFVAAEVRVPHHRSINSSTGPRPHLALPFNKRSSPVQQSVQESSHSRSPGNCFLQPSIYFSSPVQQHGGATRHKMNLSTAADMSWDTSHPASSPSIRVRATVYKSISMAFSPCCLAFVERSPVRPSQSGSVTPRPLATAIRFAQSVSALHEDWAPALWMPQPPVSPRIILSPLHTIFSEIYTM